MTGKEAPITPFPANRLGKEPEDILQTPFCYLSLVDYFHVKLKGGHLHQHTI
jgi:hypothetical protein